MRGQAQRSSTKWTVRRGMGRIKKQEEERGDFTVSHIHYYIIQMSEKIKYRAAKIDVHIK